MNFSLLGLFRFLLFLFLFFLPEIDAVLDSLPEAGGRLRFGFFFLLGLGRFFGRWGRLGFFNFGRRGGSRFRRLGRGDLGGAGDYLARRGGCRWSGCGRGPFLFAFLRCLRRLGFRRGWRRLGHFTPYPFFLGWSYRGDFPGGEMHLFPEKAQPLVNRDQQMVIHVLSANRPLEEAVT